MLTIDDHRRDRVGLLYVYPVISRRAGGVSIGINLNPNNACNWGCVYCQVPDLKRGGPPAVDLALLETELRGFIGQVCAGDYLEREVPSGMRRLVDVAFSGNGEPTSADGFADAVGCVERVLREFSLSDALTVRLITNGSLMHRPAVREGVRRIGALHGEVWFKVDRASEAGVARINQVAFSLEKTQKALLQCAELADTWVQTCWFAMDGEEADEAEQQAYLALLASLKDKIKGVHLYGLARPSLQPEAPRLAALPPEHLRRFADRVETLGIRVTVSP